MLEGVGKGGGSEGRGLRRLTGPLGSKVLGSAAWSDWSLMVRESRVERKDLANESSVMVAGWWWDLKVGKAV